MSNGVKSLPRTSVPSIDLVRSPRNAGAVIVGIGEVAGTPTLIGLPPDLEKSYLAAFGRPVIELAVDLGASAELGKVTILPSASGVRLITVGLANPDFTPSQVRRGIGAATRALAELAKTTPVTVAISVDASDPELVKAAAEGAALGAYSFAKLSTTPPTGGVSAIQVVSSAGGAKDAIEMARAISEGVLRTRDWVNTPANLLFPDSFATAAREDIKNSKIDIDVLDEKALERGGYGGILAVGGGSAHKPRLVRAEYHPRGAAQHLVLVGKGITFDTGGLNLKPAEGMYTMKSDMSGAAAVLNAIKAISDLGLNVWVTAYAAMAENMPGGESYRPSDVLTMYGGTTVENVNSDAEGRLVMADALARGAEDRPDLMIDIATLTGAAVIALGTRTAGLMASDDATADLILDAADEAGEDLWQLPIPDHLRKELDSKVADLKSGGPRQGGALTAAAFLQRFVPEGTPWAHLDIAGPAFNEGNPYDDVPSGGTGAGVRTLVALAAAMKS